MKFLLIILFCVFSQNCFSQVQVPTSTIKDCNLLSGYNGKSFTEFTPVKSNTPLTIIGKWETAIYTVMYNEQVYQIYSGNIKPHDWYKFDNDMKNHIEATKQAKKDSILKAKERDKFIKDSIRIAHELEVEKAHLEYVRRKDSLRNIAEGLLKKIKSKYPIYITKLYVSYPNSAEGVNLVAEIENTGKKPIKYISFSGYPINAVGDRCYCSIRRYSTTSARGVGPIAPGESTKYIFDNLWYDDTIDYYIPTSINIQYMDGTSKAISKASINEIIKIKDRVKELTK